VRKLDARERNGRRAKGLWREHWRAATLERSMVLLDDVVGVPTAADYDPLPKGIFSP
jgi:hypothetical protein